MVYLAHGVQRVSFIANETVSIHLRRVDPSSFLSGGKVQYAQAKIAENYEEQARGLRVYSVAVRFVEKGTSSVIASNYDASRVTTVA